MMIAPVAPRKALHNSPAPSLRAHSDDGFTCGPAQTAPPVVSAVDVLAALSPPPALSARLQRSQELVARSARHTAALTAECLVDDMQAFVTARGISEELFVTSVEEALTQSGYFRALAQIYAEHFTLATLSTCLAHANSEVDRCEERFFNALHTASEQALPCVEEVHPQRLAAVAHICVSTQALRHLPENVAQNAIRSVAATLADNDLRVLSAYYTSQAGHRYAHALQRSANDRFELLRRDAVRSALQATVEG